MAVEYALQIQPGLSISQQKAVHDALQLPALCNSSFTATAPRVVTAPFGVDVGDHREIFVDAGQGSDSNRGSISSPLKSLAAAVAASRATAHSVVSAPRRRRRRRRRRRQQPAHGLQ